MDILTNPCVSIVGDRSQNRLTLRWKGYCPSEDYRSALNLAHNSVLEHRFTNWLADLRNMEAILHDDEQWTINQWFPKMYDTGLKRMAIITSSDFLNNMSVDRIMQSADDERTFDVAYFDNEPAAHDWLSGKVADSVQPVS